nr:hypothetical protein CFP56_10019 [Quercus suber]
MQQTATAPLVLLLRLSRSRMAIELHCNRPRPHASRLSDDLVLTGTSQPTGYEYSSRQNLPKLLVSCISKHVAYYHSLLKVNLTQDDGVDIFHQLILHINRSCTEFVRRSNDLRMCVKGDSTKASTSIRLLEKGQRGRSKEAFTVSLGCQATRQNVL